MDTDEEMRSSLENIQQVLATVLAELKTLWKTGIEVVCPDGKVRTGHPAVAGWFGDYPEYIKLFTAAYMSCPICLTPRNEMDAHSTTPVT